MVKTCKGFQKIFMSTPPEEASLCFLLKFADVILLCQKLASITVSSPHFVPYTLYSLMQVDNENIYL